jgi:uncharacterized membrane protein
MDIPLKAKVRASDGQIGVVGGLISDESGKAVTHLILQEGHLWGKKEVALPLAAVDRVEGDTVYLKLDKKAIEQLPMLPHKRKYVEGEAHVELVARVFNAPDKDNERLAREALDYAQDLHKHQVVTLLNAALLVKDQDGTVSVVDTREIDPKKGRVLGAITGGLVGLIAGPGGAIVGALAGLGAGGAAGKRIDEGFSDEFLKNLQDHLQPGSAAVILLVEHQWRRSAAESLAGQEGFIFQQSLTDKLVEDLLDASASDEQPSTA